MIFDLEKYWVQYGSAVTFELFRKIISCPPIPSVKFKLEQQIIPLTHNQNRFAAYINELKLLSTRMKMPQTLFPAPRSNCIVVVKVLRYSRMLNPWENFTTLARTLTQWLEQLPSIAGQLISDELPCALSLNDDTLVLRNRPQWRQPTHTLPP